MRALIGEDVGGGGCSATGQSKMGDSSFFGAEDRRLKMGGVLRSSAPKIEDGGFFILRSRRSKIGGGVILCCYYILNISSQDDMILFNYVMLYWIIHIKHINDILHI